MSVTKVTLCLGSSCHSRGNRDRVESLKEYFHKTAPHEVEISGSLCLGHCSQGPVVLIDGKLITLGADSDLIALVEDHRRSLGHRP